jgi:hypothetical protein
MFFIDHSQSILFLVLAVCALCLTLLLCIFLYHLILAARDLRIATELARTQLTQLKDLLDRIKSGFGLFGLILPMLKDLLGQAKDFLGEQTLKKSSKKTSSK